MTFIDPFWCLHVSRQVSSVNPSFHKTPIVNHAPVAIINNFNRLPEHMQEEYGSDYLDECIASTKRLTEGSWDPKHVVDAMIHGATSVNPRHQYLVGMDAKFTLPLLAMIPPRIRDELYCIFVGAAYPAAVKKQKAEKEQPLNKEGSQEGNEFVIAVQ